MICFKLVCRRGIAGKTEETFLCQHHRQVCWSLSCPACYKSEVTHHYGYVLSVFMMRKRTLNQLQYVIKGKLHSKIIISDLVGVSSFVEFDGKGPKSKLEQEHGQTDGQKWPKYLG